MAKTFRAVPWKRNVRQIPNTVVASLATMPPNANIAVVCTKRVSEAEIKAGIYHHLEISWKSGRPLYPSSILPREDSGSFSQKNVRGWEIKRTDLPKITKEIYLGERPIYGDWSNGSFSLWQEREVYQVDEHFPLDYTIDIDLLHEEEEVYIFKFNLDCTLLRRTAQFDEELLFCLNILQENVGACGVDLSAKTREEYIATTLVDWEIFPPGSFDRFIAKVKSKIGKTGSTSLEVIDERASEFKRLSPQTYILGKGGFNQYMGAVLPNSVVVFENIKYGNALYVVYENWTPPETLSPRWLVTDSLTRFGARDGDGSAAWVLRCGGAAAGAVGQGR